MYRTLIVISLLLSASVAHAATLLDIVPKGKINRSVTLRIIDSADGTPETGVVYNTSGIDLWYRREGEAKTSITEATLSALTDAHADGGFLSVSNGEYRLDVPDAAFATGANYVDVGGTVTGMIVVGGRVRLTDLDIEDADPSVDVTKNAGTAITSASGIQTVNTQDIASPPIVNWGDYEDTNQTIYVYFTTTNKAGVAAALSSGAVEIYEDGSATQITSAETLSASFDSVTGYNQIAIDLTDAGFENGKTYTAVLSGGTVDSVSVVGRVVGTFSVGRYAGITEAAADNLNAVAANTVYVYWATDATTSGTAARSAIQGASAGTEVILSEGLFDMGSSKLTVPDRVSVTGRGANATKIHTTHANGCLPGNYSRFRDLEIAIPTGSASPIFILDSDTARVGVQFKNVILRGGNDSIVVQSDDPCDVLIEDSVLHSKQDGIVVSTDNTVTLRNVQLVSDNVTTAPRGIIASDDAVVYGTNVSFYINGGATAATGIWATNNAQVILDRPSIDVRGSGTLLAIDRDDSSIVRITEGEFDRTLVSGTITDTFSPVRPTVPGRTLDVASTGEAGADFSNVNGTLDASEIGDNAITSSEAPALQYLTGDAYIRLGAPAGASIAADIASSGGGSGGDTPEVEVAKIPSANVVQVKSRGDGTFGVTGRFRLLPGETRWFAVDLKGTQLADGDLVYSQSTPVATGAQLANVTVADEGIYGSRCGVKLTLSGSAATTDTINIKFTIQPRSGHTLIVTVPVTVGS